MPQPASRRIDRRLNAAVRSGLAALALGLAFSFATAAFAQSPACEPGKAAERFPTYANKTVRFGVNPTYAPFTFDDPANPSKMAGLDVDIIEHALNCAGLKFEYVKGSTAGLYPALFAGTLDVMLGNIFIRPDRTSFVLYMVNGQSLIVSKGNPKNISSTESMRGHTATGLYVGSSAIVVKDIGKKCVEGGRKPIDYVAASDQEQAYRSLENERTDMVMDGAASAVLRVRASDHAFEIAFTLPTEIKSGVIVPRGNTEMLKAVADGMKDLQASGELQALMGKYGLRSEWLIPVEVYP
jgi:polar amino acid transport system substrate-binding protein